jgi:hypothetical protein
MQIPDADPGDQNHADPCGCGEKASGRKKEKNLEGKWEY